MHLRSSGKYYKKAVEVGTSEPTLPCMREAPKRLEVGEGDVNYASTPEEHYRAIYFEAFNLILSCIRDRFDQPGYRIFSKLEKLPLKAACGEIYDQEFVEIYGYNHSLLRSQHQILNIQVQQFPHETLSLTTV